MAAPGSAFRQGSIRGRSRRDPDFASVRLEAPFATATRPRTMEASTESKWLRFVDYSRSAFAIWGLSQTRTLCFREARPLNTNRETGIGPPTVDHGEFDPEPRVVI